MSFVEPVTESGCWFWMGAIHKKSGYGAFSIRNANYLAHRLAFTLFKGPIPEGMQVLHHCDIRCCVNPAHLFLGTHQDNMDDMVNKCRKAIGSRVHNKLNDDSVREIRSSTERQQALASKHGVTQAMVSCVKLRKSWKHLN